MAQFSSIVPTTELECVNSVLQAAGLAPIDQATLDASTHDDDTAMVITTVRNVLREVLSIGWRFNSEFGLEIAPANTYTWVASDGTSTLAQHLQEASRRAPMARVTGVAELRC
jgi:hypothetical protein